LKKILVVLDGAADYPYPTPLQKAFKPNLDEIGKNSVLFKARIAGKIAPESDVGVLSVLGFKNLNIGRGALEALGMNKYHGKSLYLRVNFATEKNGRIIDRRVGRNLTDKEAENLASEINKIKFKHPFKFTHTISHRGIFEIKMNASKNISNTDPAYVKNKNGISVAMKKFENKIQQCKALKKDKLSIETAETLNEFSLKVMKVLNNSIINKKRTAKGLLKANILLFRDAETNIKMMKKFKNWSIIADMPLERGIGKMLGMKIVKVKEDQTSKGYEERAELVKKTIKKSDGIYIHIKGPDIFAHDGDFEGKRKNIELIDKFFFKNIKNLVKKTRIAVTCDHTTSCKAKAHTNNPVPVLISGLNVFGSENKFEENNKQEIKGYEIMKILNKHTVTPHFH
jgi:2,3-bisphosphoglycerate-independent phosphoglycerate mutase